MISQADRELLAIEFEKIDIPNSAQHVRQGHGSLAGPRDEAALRAIAQARLEEREAVVRYIRKAGEFADPRGPDSRFEAFAEDVSLDIEAGDHLPPKGLTHDQI